MKLFSFKINIVWVFKQRNFKCLCIKTSKIISQCIKLGNGKMFVLQILTNLVGVFLCNFFLSIIMKERIITLALLLVSGSDQSPSSSFIGLGHWRRRWRCPAWNCTPCFYWSDWHVWNWWNGGWRECSHRLHLSYISVSMNALL